MKSGELLRAILAKCGHNCAASAFVLVMMGTVVAPCQTAVSLSGKVTTPAKQGLVGISIQLKHSGTTYQTTSKANGLWSLSSPAAPTTGLLNVPDQNFAPPRHNLSVNNGHLTVQFAGKSLLGRNVTNNLGRSDALVNQPATRSQAISDTLIYSWKGRELARDVITNAVQSGIVRILDTTQQTYVSKLVGTWKGEHQSTTVDFLIKADSSVSINRLPVAYGGSAVGYRFKGKIASATADHLLLQVPTVESTTDGKVWAPVAPNLIAAFGLATGLDCTYVLDGTNLTLTQALLGGVVLLVKQ